MADQLQRVYVCPCEHCQRTPHGEIARNHRAINRIVATLDERGRRLFVGVLASQRGHGGIVQVAEITGMSRTTIRRGLLEIQRVAPGLRGRVRRPGGGRRRLEKKKPVS
jgi:hypothetical protein